MTHGLPGKGIVAKTSNSENSSFDPESLRREGATFGRYKILRPLGEGGMGTVFLAFDTQLERNIALKIPHLHDTRHAERTKRFLREAKAAASLSHPNLCTVYDAGCTQGAHYLAMEYVDGESLSALLKRGVRVPPRKAAVLVRRLAKALAVAHEGGIVHRDLKPANVVMTAKGQPVIVDFGLAYRDDGDVQLTKQGNFVGTPAFMAPEQIRRGESVDHACDIYSLGVILYLLLAGRLPFRDPAPGVYVQIATEVPDPPSQVRTEVPKELEAICLKAMQKRPMDRYQSMVEFDEALAQYLSSSDVAEASVEPDVPSRISRAMWKSPAFIVVFGLLIGGTFAWYARPKPDVPTQPHAANTDPKSQPSEGTEPIEPAESPSETDTTKATSEPESSKETKSGAQMFRATLIVSPPEASLSVVGGAVEGSGKQRILLVSTEVDEITLSATAQGYVDLSTTVSRKDLAADTPIVIPLLPHSPTEPTKESMPTKASETPADANPPTLTPQEVLEQKGLVALSQTLSLKSELELTQRMEALQPFKANLLEATSECNQLELQEREKDKTVLDLKRQWRALESVQQRAKNTNDNRNYNRIVIRRNEMVTKIRELEAATEDRKLKILRENVGHALSQYQQKVWEVRAFASEIEKQYQALGNDPEVENAVNALTGPDWADRKIAPTRAFAKNVRELQKMVDALLESSIAVKHNGNKVVVDVRLNGKITVEMDYDPRSKWILLPQGIAARLGIRPSTADPRVTLTLPDGTQYEGIKSRLKSVQVGGQTMEDVECILLPEAFETSRPLLGMSFLRGFTHGIVEDRLVLQPLGASSAMLRP